MRPTERELLGVRELEFDEHATLRLLAEAQQKLAKLPVYKSRS